MSNQIPAAGSATKGRSPAQRLVGEAMAVIQAAGQGMQQGHGQHDNRPMAEKFLQDAQQVDLSQLDPQTRQLVQVATPIAQSMVAGGGIV